MLNKINKKIVTALAVLILISINGEYAQAQTKSPNDSSSCPVSYYIKKFPVFLSNLISYDDFTEYFKDIFARNMCQRDDIFALQEQLEKQTARIRKAYENCEFNDIPNLENGAYKLQMEIMYLRKFVINNPDKAASDQIVIAVPDLVVKSQLMDYFVDRKKIYDIDSFETTYSDVKKKYSSKLNDYNNCKDATWEELTQKWNEFLQTAGGLSTGMDKMQKSIERKKKKLNESPPERRGSFLEKISEIRINGMKPKEGLREIYDEFNKNLPQGSLGTYSELLQNIQSVQNSHELEISEAELISEYKMLYGEDVDPSIQVLIEKIKELNQILKDTFPVQKDLFKCSKTVQEKQCKNKS